MKYIEFCESIKNQLQRMMGDGYDVKLERVLKNNHVAYEAIVILQKGRYIAPSVYLEQYYDSYKEGKNITDICLSIMVQYEKYKDGVELDSKKLMDYKQMKDSLFVKVINTAMNEELLQDMPHLNYYDLSMVAFLRIEDDGISNATMNISNGHLKIWDMDEDALFKDAINNTREKMPYRFSTMSDVMKEILYDKVKHYQHNVGNDEELDYALVQSIEAIEMSEKDTMYVLTNSNKMDGAVYLLFDDVMETIAEKMQSDLYIIPSSIHEVMILRKDKKIDYAELCNLVKDVNEKELDPREVLSDTIYIYERGKGIKWRNP